MKRESHFQDKLEREKGKGTEKVPGDPRRHASDLRASLIMVPTSKEGSGGAIPYSGKESPHPSESPAAVRNRCAGREYIFTFPCHKS